jgi:hypothetical protein
MHGGLGNQLFQIFHLLAYCKKYNKQFSFSNKKILLGNRFTYWDTFLIALQPYLVDDENICQLREIIQDSFCYQEYPDLGDDFQFVGHFQSPLFFESYKEDIFTLLNFRHLQENIQYDENIDFEKTTSLHFRIGDYKNFPDYHPILNIEYYIECLRRLQEEDKNMNVLYFYEREDQDVIFEKINVLKSTFPSFSFSSGIDEKEDWEQLLMMSKCKHHIIANSSFSWWAAYFNQKKGKTFYPSIWFGIQCYENVSDLFPDYMG